MIRLLLFALLFAMPAAADDVFMNNTTSESNMCVIDVTGQSQSTPSVVAHANWSPITYNCAAGTYLPAGNNWTSDTQYDNGCETCPAGSYCVGGNYEYSDTTASGVTSCNATYSGTTSVAGATNSAACYYANVSCPTISANTACDPHAATCAYSSQNTTGDFYLEPRIYTGSCAMNFTCATGYTKSTTQTSPTLPNQQGDSSEYHSHSNNNNSTNGSSLPTGGWSVTWTSGATQGTIAGVAACNSTPGSDASSILPIHTDSASISTTGKYCWCKPTTWTPSGENSQDLSAAWMFRYNGRYVESCAVYCAQQCADGVKMHPSFRSALFDTIGNAEQCTPATYNINYVLNGGSSVPSTYTQLEYIQSDGNSYINTTINGNMSYSYELDFQQTNTGLYRHWGAFGQASYVGPNMSLTYTYPDNFAIRWESQNGSENGLWAGKVDTDRHILRIDNGAVYFDGVNYQKSQGHQDNFEINYPLFLGTANPGGTTPSANAMAKYYHYSVKNKNNTLIQNLIPARRNSDNKCGMYDTVSGTFFTSATSTDFVCSPELPSQYTYGTGATVNATPTRSHSSFVGWCTDAGLTNCAATQTIGTTATGDKTFYAKYLCDTGYSTNVSNTACNANTITVNWDNGAGGATQNTCTYGGDLTTPTTAPTKRGHVFTGWTFDVGN